MFEWYEVTIDVVTTSGAEVTVDDAFYETFTETFQPYYWTRVAETGVQVRSYVTQVIMTISGFSQDQVDDPVQMVGIGNSIQTGICEELQKSKPELDCKDVTAIINNVRYNPSRRLVDELRRKLAAGDLEVTSEVTSSSASDANDMVSASKVIKNSPASLGATITQVAARPTFNIALPPTITSSVQAVATKAAEYVSYHPTTSPTAAPTHSPTAAPTDAPTAAPTPPTPIPTPYPTLYPTEPTSEPTTLPTTYPTAFPTQSPTSPTAAPTLCPTATPTAAPTKLPDWEEDQLSRAELAGAGFGAILALCLIVFAVVYFNLPKAHAAKSVDDPVTASQIEGSLVRMQEV